MAIRRFKFLKDFQAIKELITSHHSKIEYN